MDGSDDWKGEHLLRGIRAKPGEASGVTLPGMRGRKAQTEARKMLRKRKPTKHPDDCSCPICGGGE